MRNAFEKVFMGAAGSAGGAGGLDVDDVFSTYLYKGTNNTLPIANGIDLDGEGGMWWIKNRGGSNTQHLVFDSERSTNSEHSVLFPALNNADNDGYSTTPTSTGFTINTTSEGPINQNGQTYVSWAWRKAPKFFDVVTYTGNGQTNRQVSHNLGSAPGCIIVKRTNGVKDWAVYHRGRGNTHYGTLNTNEAFYDSITWWQDTDPTSADFTVGNSLFVNANGDTYVAYLFAHNDGDGEFGPDSDQDIIKCGSYTGNGSNTGPVIDLGFEPQWLIIKGATIAKEWRMFDTMRGMPVGGSGAFLQANSSAAEGTDTGPVALNANGFQLTQGGSETNNSGSTYIYMAIRRGSLAPPTAATEVFAAAYGNSSGEPAFTSNFPVDFGIWHGPTSGNENKASTRLTQGRTLNMDDTSAEASSTAWVFDYQDGFMSSGGGSSNFATMWKRAPSFCDVVCYKGVSGSQTINHNLGVSPDLIFVKNRSDAVSWSIYHSAVGKDKRLILGGSIGTFYAADTDQWQNTAPTSTAFYVNGDNNMSGTGDNLIAYLFATLAGVSKLGGYTGNGSSQTIDCGFASGSRFILVKRTDSAAGNNAGDWFIWDSVRGIASGNDPHLSLNTDAAHVTNDDSVDPASSGFIVNQVSATNINVTNATYVYYAIA